MKSTEEIILDSARHLFATRGFSPTSIDKIAKNAGLAKGTIFYHFPDKEKILTTMFQEELIKHKRSLEEIVKKNIGLEKQTEEIVNFIIKEIIVNRDIHRILFRNLLLERSREESQRNQAWEEIYKTVERLIDMIKTTIHQGIKEGVFKKSLNAESVTFAFLGMAIGILLMEEDKESQAKEKKLSQNIFQLIMHGIIAEDQ